METNVSRMIPVGLFTPAASAGMVFALLHELQDEHDLSVWVPETQPRMLTRCFAGQC